MATLSYHTLRRSSLIRRAKPSPPSTLPANVGDATTDLTSAVSCGERERESGAAAIRRPRTYQYVCMVMHASMWVLGVAAVERPSASCVMSRCRCRGCVTIARGLVVVLWSERAWVGCRKRWSVGEREGRNQPRTSGKEPRQRPTHPVAPLPASTRRAAGSTRTLPFFSRGQHHI